jgi:transcriptional regulator with XRE-family HTH domain
LDLSDMAERAADMGSDEGNRHAQGGTAIPLGGRLREERDRRGLTLRELARRLEVSASLVSQIETGKVQPSVKTLYAMVSELGVTLDAVFPPAKKHENAAETKFEPSEQGERVQRAHDRQSIELESGVRWERLTTWNDRDVEFLYAIYAVGGASSPDGAFVRHNGREFGIVLSGRLGVEVGFEEYVLGPGDSISFASSTPHRLSNNGEEAVHAVWVVIGRHDPSASAS